MDWRAARDAALAERDALLAHNERLHHLLLKLKRMQFGARSERLPEEQLQLGLEDLEGAIAEGEARAEKRDPELRRDKVAKRRASRGALPAHLPRVEVTLAPEDDGVPVLPGGDGGDRHRHRRAPGRDPGTVPGAGDAPAEAGLPGLRGRGGAGACAARG